MKATIIDGNHVAKLEKQKAARMAEELKSRGIFPALTVILVGENPASQTYVKWKEKDCQDCGILSATIRLPEETSEAELLSRIDELNRDASVHGILVQLPLPAHINEKNILRAIDPAKDVDAFHPYNVGLIMQGEPVFLPCTPAGVMLLLEHYGIDPAGAHCVVVGRSDIVGKPQAMLLLHKHATVTICHSRTKDLAEHTKRADILISAVGKAGLITADMVKEGAVVIDVAMNVGKDGKLCGDVLFDEVSRLASYISPVPGGVGPMTRAVLMRNTVSAASAQQY